LRAIEVSLSATDAARDAVQEILRQGADTGIFFSGAKGRGNPSFELTAQDKGIPPGGVHTAGTLSRMRFAPFLFWAVVVGCAPAAFAAPPGVAASAGHRRAGERSRVPDVRRPVPGDQPLAGRRAGLFLQRRVSPSLRRADVVPADTRPSSHPDPYSDIDAQPGHRPVHRLAGGPRRTPSQRRLRQRFLRFIPIRSGQHVLEVGCGTGVVLRDIRRWSIAASRPRGRPEPVSRRGCAAG